MDHLAAAEHRVRRVEDLGRPVEATRRCRAEHLVPAERQEVAAERAARRSRWCGASCAASTATTAPDRVRGVDELPEGRDRAERVRHAGDRQDLRPLGEQRAEVGEVQLPVIGERDVAERRAGDGGGHLPRDDVGVMLHVGEQHLVALMEELPSPALRDQVHGFGGAAGEHDGLGTGRAEEPRELRARALEQLGRLLAQHVEATMGVRVVVRVEVGLRVDHLLRLLGRRGAVQVDHAADRPPCARGSGSPCGSSRRPALRCAPSCSPPDQTSAVASASSPSSSRTPSYPLASSSFASSGPPVFTIRPFIIT